MSYKRRIRKNSKLNKANYAESTQMNARTKQIMLNVLLNIVFFCILCSISRFTLLSAILLFGYELLLGVMVWRTSKNVDNKHKGNLGIWNLLVIAAAGVLFRLKYEFFEIPQSSFSLSFDEKKALAISGVIAVCIAVIVNKITQVKPEIWMNLVLVCVLVFSMIGHVLLLNDTLPKQKYNEMEYYVKEKMINDRIFKSYLISLEYDDTHGFIVSVNKDEYAKIKADDKYLVTVYKGGLGLKYVKTDKRYLKVD